MMNNVKFLTLTAIGIACLGLGACETLDGAGQDIENAGESIQRAAN